MTEKSHFFLCVVEISLLVGKKIYDFAVTLMKNGGKLWLPTKEDEYMGAHAMIVVSYNDKLNAFELMNSFGAGFGKDGYVWIRYKDFQDKCNMAYDITYQNPQAQYTQQEEVYQAEKSISIVPWMATTNFYRVGRNREILEIKQLFP